MNVAIIPARGGSQRIPGKNIKDFHGIPVVAYSIVAAKKTGLFQRVIVSTDSPDIAEIAQGFGAEVPFLRPLDISDHHSSIEDVLLHALQWLFKEGEHFSYCCCLLATAPFVSVAHILSGYALIKERSAQSVISVTSFPFPIFRSLEIDESGRVAMKWPEYENARSNDLPEMFHDAGQFYWLEIESFLASEALYAPYTLPVVLPRKFVQDLDTQEDWERAELMYHALLKRGEIEGFVPRFD